MTWAAYLTQLKELISRKWEQTNPGTEDSLCLKQSIWHWSDHCMTNCKMIIRASCGVLHIALSLHQHTTEIPLKVLTPDQQRGVGFWTQVRLFPRLPASWIKQPFFSTNICLKYWLSSVQQLNSRSVIFLPVWIKNFIQFQKAAICVQLKRSRNENHLPEKNYLTEIWYILSSF